MLDNNDAHRLGPKIEGKGKKSSYLSGEAKIIVRTMWRWFEDCPCVSLFIVRVLGHTHSVDVFRWGQYIIKTYSSYFLLLAELD